MRWMTTAGRDTERTSEVLLSGANTVRKGAPGSGQPVVLAVRIPSGSSAPIWYAVLQAAQNAYRDRGLLVVEMPQAAEPSSRMLKAGVTQGRAERTGSLLERAGFLALGIEARLTGAQSVLQPRMLDQLARELPVGRGFAACLVDRSCQTVACFGSLTSAHHLVRTLRKTLGVQRPLPFHHLPHGFGSTPTIQAA